MVWCGVVQAFAERLYRECLLVTIDRGVPLFSKSRAADRFAASATDSSGMDSIAHPSTDASHDLANGKPNGSIISASPSDASLLSSVSSSNGGGAGDRVVMTDVPSASAPAPPPPATPSPAPVVAPSTDTALPLPPPSTPAPAPAVAQATPAPTDTAGTASSTGRTGGRIKILKAVETTPTPAATTTGQRHRIPRKPAATATATPAPPTAAPVPVAVAPPAVTTAIAAPNPPPPTATVTVSAASLPPPPVPVAAPIVTARSIVGSGGVSKVAVKRDRDPTIATLLAVEAHLYRQSESISDYTVRCMHVLDSVKRSSRPAVLFTFLPAGHADAVIDPTSAAALAAAAALSMAPSPSVGDLALKHLKSELSTASASARSKTLPPAPALISSFVPRPSKVLTPREFDLMSDSWRNDTFDVNAAII